MRKIALSIAAVMLFALSGVVHAASDQPMRIAFMPDFHFHDVYAELGDGSFDGVVNPRTGQRSFVRTMYAQVNSTRLLNENYFVLFATLDDAVSRGIKYIVLPGDFTDNGQPVHTITFKNIIDEYAKKYGLVFIATNGNHDPYRPYGRPAGKMDFLGVDGSNQRVFSRGMNECKNYQGDAARIDTGEGLPVACTEVIKDLGYSEIGDIMAAYGFRPRPEFIYWETPYSTYDQDSYDYETARHEARWENRTYEICVEGAGGEHKKSNFTTCASVPDFSYLIELENDVWLMMIDANIYRINPKSEYTYPTYPGLFEGSNNAGYNAMQQYKPQVLDWMRSVVKRAEANGKRLIAASHFPMTEYYGGIGNDIVKLFGKDKLQTVRLPSELTMTMLANTGVKVHVGGHMHFNSTNHVRSGDNFLVNIQSPSPSSYGSGYKIMTLHDNDRIEVETIRMNDVPRFDELFDLYRIEHQYLGEHSPKKQWNDQILEAKTFREYCDIYFRELTRHRFLGREWPADMSAFLPEVKGSDLLVLAQLPEKVTFGAFSSTPDNPVGDVAKALKASLPKGTEAKGMSDLTEQWNAARNEAEKILAEKGLNLSDFDWSGFELAVDFHRIINAGELALPDIPTDRLEQYKILAGLLDVHPGDRIKIPTGGKDISPNLSMANWTRMRFGDLVRIIDKKLKSDPDVHFMIDYANKSITKLD